MAAAQDLAWVMRDQGLQVDPQVRLGVGGSRPLENHNLAIDAAGNVYVSGTSFGPTSDIVTMKLDASGAAAWTTLHDGGASDRSIAVAVDPNASVYVLGSSSLGGSYLVKYGAGGVLQWVRPVGSPTGRFNDLAADAAGNLYVAGRDSGFRIIKYDTSGVMLWSVAPTTGEVAALALDGSGSVYATGNFQVVKLSGAGTVEWTAAYGGTGARQSFDLTVDDSGAVYVAGYRFNGTNEDFLTVKFSAAGAQQWASTYDGGSFDIAFAVVADGSGNVWVTGQSDTPAQGGFLTVKYGPSGQQQWVASYDTDGYDISYALAVDSGGNAYVAGRSQEGSAGAFRTIRYDADGVQQWVGTFDRAGEDVAYAILVDGEGDLVVAGSSVETGDDLRVVKYDAGGTELWTAKEGQVEAPDVFGSPAAFSFTQTGRTLEAGAAGYAYLAGASYNGRNYDVRLAKVDASGARQWVTVLDTGGDDDPVALARDVDDHVYLISGGRNTAGGWNVHTTKFAPNGAELWHQVYDGGADDFPGDIAVDSAGNVYAVGWSASGPNPHDFLVIKYDASGNQQWAATYDGGRTDVAPAVAIDGAGNLIVSGSSQNPDLHWDMLTVKFDANGGVRWSAREIHENFGAVAVDPSGNAYVVSGHSDIQITRYDADGVAQWKVLHDGGSQEVPVGLELQGGSVHVAAFTYNGTDYDFRTLKYSDAGVLQWVAVYDEGFEVAQGLAVDSGGNVFVAGYSLNDRDYDARLVKYDTLGVEQWTAFYDNGADDFGYAIEVDAAGGVLVAGDSVAFTSSSDMLLLKYLEQTRTVEFSTPASGLSERARTAALSVTLSTSDGLPSTTSVTVCSSTLDGSAVAGQDYQAGNGLLTFPAGTLSGSVLNVNVDLVEDAVDEADEMFAVRLDGPSGAILGSIATHVVTIFDDDTAGFAISPRGGLRTTEAGASDTFSVALTSQPTAEVSLVLSSSDPSEGLVSPGSLTFSPADWNVPRVVTITGVDDSEVDGLVVYAVVLQPATSADLRYQGLDPEDVEARNQDDDRGRRP
jgi:hypothetical protein